MAAYSHSTIAVMSSCTSWCSLAQDQYTEQRQRFVDTFCIRRGIGSGGPLQICDKSGKMLFAAVIPSNWPARAIDHDSPIMVASMSKVVTGMAVLISMEIFQTFGIEVGGHEFSPNLAIHSIGCLEDAEFPDEFSRLDPVLRNIRIKSHWSGRLFGTPLAEEFLETPISFRHLLTHTSGISGAHYVGKDGYIHDFSVLDFQPGDSFQYGCGYDVAGRALVAIWRKFGAGFRFETANKQPADWETLNDVVNALIFGPLEMTNSEFKDMHTYAEEEGLSLMERLTRGKNITAKQQYGGRDLQTTGHDFSKFLVMLLNRGRIPAGPVVGNATLKIRHVPHIETTFDVHRLLSESKFVEYVLQNHLPAAWDETEDTMVNKVHGGNSYTGLDHHMGHSLVAAVSRSKSPDASPRDMYDLRRPGPGELGTHIYWRGLMSSVWHIDYERGMSFVHVTRNPQRLARVVPRVIEGCPRKTFTVNHDWLIGPLFLTMNELMCTHHQLTTKSTSSDAHLAAQQVEPVLKNGREEDEASQTRDSSIDS